MYHVHFRGTHYQMGYHWGAALAKRGHFLLAHIPFEITPDRIAFAEACLPIYQRYFPEILEEIQGLASGQNCKAALLQAVLFSMYAMPPACNCSCFAVSNRTHILFGRNSDFLTALERLNMNVIYRFSSASYDFTGNTTAFLEMEDGINAHGLAIGLTAVSPTSIKAGFSAGLLLRFCLEKCRRTAEVIQLIKRLPIASAQTFTIADTSGEIAVIESCADGCVVLSSTTQQPFVCATNLFCSPELSAQQNLEVDNWQAQTRYDTLSRTLSADAKEFDVQKAQQLLAGENGFLCQYDRSTGKDTVWSVLYDLNGQAIYRVEGNPNRCKFCRDERFSFTTF